MSIGINNINYQLGFNAGYARAKADIKHGQWINVKISISGNSSAECSLCGAVVHNDFSNVINYCPNCGAKMDLDEVKNG